MIDADDYFDWIKIGAALHAEFGDDGFEMFDAWSQKSKKYDARNVLRKWRDCAAMSEYTVGSIFHAADEANMLHEEAKLLPPGAVRDAAMSSPAG